MPKAAIAGLKEKSNDSAIKHLYAGWTFSYAAGNPSLGRPALMTSIICGYKVEPWYDVEIGIHHLGLGIREPLGGIFGDTLRAYSNSFTFDVLMMIRPFSFLPQFRIGIGPSLHWAVRMFPAIDPAILALNDVTMSEMAMVGGVLKVDYTVPLSKKLEIGLRGQINVFAKEFQGFNQSPVGALYGFAGVGAFLQFRW